MSENILNKGNLLIAEPSILNDRSFNRSVILLTEHNQNGTVGFILNKPSEYLLKDLIPELGSNHIVYIGGPVSEDNLYFLHRIPNLIPDSIEVKDGIFWGGNFEVIQQLLIKDNISPNDIRFFLGYTGWSENQLEEEMEQISWFVKENTYENILTVQPNSFWKEELLKSGDEYQIWANAPKDPRLN